MTRTPEQVALASSRSYTFKFGEYISQGFNIIGKNPGLFIAFSFVYFLIMMVCQIIPLFGPIASAIATPCLTVGYYLTANKQDQGKTIEFGDFFQGFDHIGQLILAALIQGAIMLIAMIPIGFSFFFAIGMTSGSDGFPVLMTLLCLLVILPIIYLYVSWFFAPMLIVFHKMEAWQAMEASRKIISSNWVMFFFFSIVTGFIMMLGLLALGFGILYTMPAVMCMYYAAFRDIVGVPGTADKTSFMDHLVD